MFSADTRKIFHQILVRKNRKDQDAQIMHSPYAEISTYVMKAMILCEVCIFATYVKNFNAAELL